ncbi:diguanylate cyclase [uncultured Clostridium sp.]|uniref:diguanylate cyclase n=1 Tax=uncultured Clostridium sp. TaxID=59620 RepID=UPI0025F6F9DC|nr:diguanylate cyclase [uncultured Clostridium sp.]
MISFPDYNLLKEDNAMLDGQWDLYYNELLSPDDLKNRKPDTFYNIPGRLSSQIDNARTGYMTLHLKINVPEDDVYGIYFSEIFTSAKIWINGINYGGYGTVAESLDEEKASYKPQYLYFPSENKEIDIVINTSVYREIKPYLRSPIFGLKDNIMKINLMKVSMDGLTIGVMLIMIIINAGFFFASTRKKRHIYFSAICFILILRCLVFNSRLLVQFFPGTPYELISKIAAITFYLWVALYIFFLNDVFDNKIKIVKPAAAFGTFFTLLCIFTSNMVYDNIQIISHIIIAGFIIYLLWFMLKEIKNKNKKAQLNFLSFIILCIAAINDILVNNAVVPNQYSALYGGILFVIMELLYIFTDYQKSMKKLENLNRDGLTTLYNNKYIKTLLSQLIQRYINWKERFSLLMIDIDNFKSINDTYGHMFGDRVILDVATILLAISDDKGYAGRFGGDEFILILPGADEKEAFDTGMEIMKKLEHLNELNHAENPISVSIGVYENTCTSVQDCMNNADYAMYKSKTGGKNQISMINSAII